jgi:hypothetical protein
MRDGQTRFRQAELPPARLFAIRAVNPTKQVLAERGHENHDGPLVPQLNTKSAQRTFAANGCAMLGIAMAPNFGNAAAKVSPPRPGKGSPRSTDNRPKVPAM